MLGSYLEADLFVIIHRVRKTYGVFQSVIHWNLPITEQQGGGKYFLSKQASFLTRT
jgi:hypothetical protein